MKISGARVIAQSLPALTHPPRLGFGERLHRWKPSEEPVVEADHARDLRLLQHGLRHEDAIWIARRAPGQVTTMLSEPDPQRPAEARRARRLDTRCRHQGVVGGIAAKSPSSIPTRCAMEIPMPMLATPATTRTARSTVIARDALRRAGSANSALTAAMPAVVPTQKHTR